MGTILRDVVSGADGLSLCFDGTKYIVVNNDPEFKMGEMSYTAVKAMKLGGNSGVMAVSTGANMVVGFHKVHQIARGDSFCTQGAGFDALTALQSIWCGQVCECSQVCSIARSITRIDAGGLYYSMGTRHGL